MNTNAVLDASAFTEGIDLWAISKTLMTTRTVINKVRANKYQKYRPLNETDDWIKYKDELIMPETINLVNDFAWQTGDLESLTRSDIEAIALTYDMHVKNSPTDNTLRKMPRVSRYDSPDAQFFLNWSRRPYRIPTFPQESTLFAKDNAEESDDDDLGSDLKLFTSTTGDYHETVGCITTKFAVQSVLLQMGLRVFTPEGKSIEQLRRIIRQCPRPCFATSTDLDKRICTVCGDKMRVVGAFIDRRDFEKRKFTNIKELRSIWGPKKQFVMPTIEEPIRSTPWISSVQRFLK